jgi:hypothetical protein
MAQNGNRSRRRSPSLIVAVQAAVEVEVSETRKTRACGGWRRSLLVDALHAAQAALSACRPTRGEGQAGGAGQARQAEQVVLVVGRLSRWGEPGVSRVETERGMRRETPRGATLSVSATRSPLYQDDKKFRRKRRHGTAPRTVRVPAQRTRCPQRSGWVSQAVEGRCRKNDPTCRGQRACGRRCRAGVAIGH